MKRTLLTGAMLAMGLIPMAQGAAKIKIMYATTPNVRNSHGGSLNAKSKLNTKHVFLRETNSNSSTGINWSKVSHYNSSYDEEIDSQIQIDRIENHSVHQPLRNKRNSRKADLVQLYCDFSGPAGRGQQPGWISVVRNSVLGIFSNSVRATHSHEVGHNMNANHEQGICISGNLRTIMETTGCSGDGNNRQNVFSSNTRTFNGNSIGDSNHNNRTRVRNQRNTAKNYK